MKKLSLVLLLVLHAFSAEFIVEDINNSKKSSTWIMLPYMFSSETMGLTAGGVAIFSGFIQPQMTIVASGFIGEEKEVKKLNAQTGIEKESARAAGGIIAIDGYRPPFSKRTFVSLLASYAYYPNQRLYINGSNESKKNLEDENPLFITPLQTQGYNNWLQADIRYVLPWGESANDTLPIIKVKRGIAVNRDKYGGGVPFVTGQTLIGSEFFYTHWSADKLIEEPSLDSNGFRFFFRHNNTDYPSNPSRGYDMNFQVSLDAGWGESTQSWNAVDAQYTHYIELPDYSWTRQSTIALNIWTAYSPSWDKSKKLNPDDPYSVLDAHQPPMYEGARLGGYKRLRAYDSNRFNDKAAIYAAVEYRLIPDFNPMRDQKWSPIPIDWFQAVVFAEAGRVAPQYNLQTLLSDMKYDAGFSIRALAAKVPVRFDMAFGDEGSSMWVMVKQPF